MNKRDLQPLRLPWKDPKEYNNNNNNNNNKINNNNNNNNKQLL